MWKIRNAAEADGTALHEIAESTFRETFGPFNTREDMDLHCSRAFTREAQARELKDPRMETLVVEGAEDDSGAGAPFAAYAQLRGGPAPPCIRSVSPLEIQRFYVRPGLHGAGLAQTLMAAVLGRARERGADAVWLGVWERNPRAIRFYGKCGFREAGDQTFLLGTDPQRDLVLIRELDSIARGVAQR